MAASTTPPDTPPFPELLRSVQDRSAALREAFAAAPDPNAAVPSCPDWSLRDLVAHLGEVHRSWAVVVQAGPREGPPTDETVGDTAPHGDLLQWSAESTAVLLDALRSVGPDQSCWTWWPGSPAPMTSGAVARHQAYEAAVHAYDAQEAAGRPEPVPVPVALDGITEFLTVYHGVSGTWPNRPARVGLLADEGPSWLVDLTSSGAVLIAHDGGDDHKPDAVVLGSASDLLLALYTRVPVDRLRVEGDRALVEELLRWPSLD